MRRWENTGQRPSVGCQSQEALLGSDVQDEGRVGINLLPFLYLGS